MGNNILTRKELWTLDKIDGLIINLGTRTDDR